MMLQFKKPNGSIMKVNDHPLNIDKADALKWELIEDDKKDDKKVSADKPASTKTTNSK